MSFFTGEEGYARAAICAAGTATFGLLGYILMIVFTYGHIYNNPNTCDKKDWRPCELQRDQQAFGYSIFWPFYWSIQAQKPDNLETK